MTIQEPNPAYGAHLNAYAGIPTFMRQRASRQLDGVDVAIVGVPFDSGAVSFHCATVALVGVVGLTLPQSPPRIVSL